MFGRASGQLLWDTFAQEGFDLLPESVIAQRVTVGMTWADATNTDRRDPI